MPGIGLSDKGKTSDGPSIFSGENSLPADWAAPTNVQNFRIGLWPRGNGLPTAALYFRP